MRQEESWPAVILIDNDVDNSTKKLGDNARQRPERERRQDRRTLPRSTYTAPLADGGRIHLVKFQEGKSKLVTGQLIPDRNL